MTIPRPVGTVNQLTRGKAHDLNDTIDAALQTEQPMETLRAATESRAAAATAEGTQEQ